MYDAGLASQANWPDAARLAADALVQCWTSADLSSLLRSVIAPAFSMSGAGSNQRRQRCADAVQLLRDRLDEARAELPPGLDVGRLAADALRFGKEILDERQARAEAALQSRGEDADFLEDLDVEELKEKRARLEKDIEMSGPEKPLLVDYGSDQEAGETSGVEDLTGDGGKPDESLEEDKMSMEDVSDQEEDSLGPLLVDYGSEESSETKEVKKEEIPNRQDDDINAENAEGDAAFHEFGSKVDCGGDAEAMEEGPEEESEPNKLGSESVEGAADADAAIDG